MRVIALTGVPGTGKTTIARHLADRFTVVSASELAHQVDAVTERDDARDADVVDETQLQARARAALPDGDVLVEGMLAHFCDPDAVVLLRCHPTELGRRLAEKGFPEAKVEENVMAETLDALVSEIETEPAWEIDTTGVDPSEVAARIVALFTGEPLEEGEAASPGTVDWTETLL